MLTFRDRHRTSSSRALIHACALVMSMLGLLPFTSPLPAGVHGASLVARAVRGAVPAGTPSRGPSIADRIFPLWSLGESREKFLKDLAWALAARPPVDVGRAAADLPRAFAGGDRGRPSLAASTVLRI